MRNLKRVLSLVMMIALLAGLMIVGASAAYQDFTDKDKIENKVAVETLVELNVIAGKEDGSFYDPEGLLTRAEAAKLVCVVLNGGKEPVLGNPDYVSYKDTKGTWGAAYIEYVTSLKIVAGDGQGYFKPDETVTGTQLAKMLLVALNYDANFENLVGNQWDSKTDALANQTELYEGLASGFVTSDPLNRDDAAQIIYNALTAHLVEYTSAGTDGSVGTHAVETNATVLSKYFNTAAVVGMVVANDVFTIANGGAKAPKGKMVLSVDTINDVRPENGSYPDTLPIGVDNDMVGQEVTVYVKNYGKTTESVLGSVIATENNKIVTTTAALEDADDVNDFLKDNDLTVDAGSGVVINGVYSDVGADKVKGDTCLQMAKAGSERRLIDNDNDGTVDVAFVTNKTLSKVTIYNTKESEITLAGETKMSFDDIVAYDGIAKGDYVLYVTYGSVTYIEKAQTVTGKVASFNKANNKATIDGTAYAESIVDTAASIGLTNYLGEGTEAADGVDMIGETYVFYLDNSGNIIATGPVVEGAKQYGLVIASNADVNSLGEPTGVIKLVLADGNEVAYNVDLAASADEYLKSELAGSTVQLKAPDGTGTPLTTNASKTEKQRAMAIRLAKKDGAYATYKWANGPLSEVAADGMVNHIVSYVVNDDGTVTIAPTQANKNNYNMQGATEDAIRTNSAYVQDSNTILADNSTIYFFVNANGKVTVVTGINSLPTTDAGAAQVSSVAYTEQDGKYTAKAVVVDGAVKEEGTYVYILDKAEALGSNEYKYPVVSAADAGTITYLDSKVADQAAGLYKVTMEDGFAKFDQTNVVADAEVDQISADGSTLKTTTAQYTVLSTVKVVNVVDTDAPFAAELADLQDGQTISIVTDSDGYVAEIFITADAQQ